MLNTIAIKKLLSHAKIAASWAFAETTRKETAYLTHAYHRYPAKFIPQLVSRLITQYTEVGDLVLDPFGGCGTTLVEAKVRGRASVGTDINPIAVLISKAKTSALPPSRVEKHILRIVKHLQAFNGKVRVNMPNHERIDYWFRPEEKRKLAFLLAGLSTIQEAEVRDFFYCGFSNILKSCSIWMQKSNKPTRDSKKTPADPFVLFPRHIKAMHRKNTDFYHVLQAKGFLETPCDVYDTDARTIPLDAHTVDLIVTSPPYVTSYEYADLHQLSTLWFEHSQDLKSFRKEFIGTFYHNKKKLFPNSETAACIREALSTTHQKTAEAVATYFSEMNQAFGEMHRLLKPEGHLCIVIGNTRLKGVAILNAEVFVEQLQNIGFTMEDIIKREIPSKTLPSTRSSETGRFVKATATQKTLAYPTEYILIMKKSWQ